MNVRDSIQNRHAGLNIDDPIMMVGFGQAQTMVAVLGLVPGVKAGVDGERDPFYVGSMQVVRYSNGSWVPIGDVITKYEGRTPHLAK